MMELMPALANQLGRGVDEFAAELGKRRPKVGRNDRVQMIEYIIESLLSSHDLYKLQAAQNA